MLERLRRCARTAKGQPVRPVFAGIAGVGCVLMLSGCEITFDRPELEVGIPPAYRAAITGGVRPALDWWRTFRSAELTKLIEEAQTRNFDIAAAIARIEQADAQSRIAGAPLLPTVNLNASES